jgi:hypothetical protein
MVCHPEPCFLLGKLGVKDLDFGSEKPEILLRYSHQDDRTRMLFLSQIALGEGEAPKMTRTPTHVGDFFANQHKILRFQC